MCLLFQHNSHQNREPIICLSIIYQGLANRPFSDDVTHTWKFDYYSADHTGGQHVLWTYYALCSTGKNPTSTQVLAGKLCLGIAMCERRALFVEQRGRFQLLFIVSPCDLLSWSYYWKSPFSKCTICAYSGEQILHKWRSSPGWIQGLRELSYSRVGIVWVSVSFLKWITLH